MTENKKKSRWGIGIAVVYGIFMLAMIAVVVASRFQQVDLVAKDYYDKEIQYQEQIERMKRSQAEGFGLSIKHDVRTSTLRVTFPAEVASSGITGTVKLFRPSNAALDRNFELNVEKGSSCELDCGKLARGLWKIKIDWQIDTLQYYHEEELHVE